VTQIAQSIFNLPIVVSQERWFMNRFGQIIYEDILHFEAQAQVDNQTILRAKHIAQQALEEAYNQATITQQKNILLAIQKILVILKIKPPN